MKKEKKSLVEKKRDKMMKRLEKKGISYSEITCDGCDVKQRCLGAYKEFNIDGDCSGGLG